MKNEITAKRLTLALSNANMKPQELADKSGVSKSSISQYVNGSHAPSNISSGKMAPILKVNPLWLMGFDVPMVETEQSKSQTVTPHFDSKKFNDLIEKYKVLDDDGKETVDFILNKEYKRCTADYIRQKDGTEYIIETIDKNQTADRFTSYLNAAHADDYANAPEELKQLEEDMMDDENF